MPGSWYLSDSCSTTTVWTRRDIVVNWESWEPEEPKQELGFFDSNGNLKG